MPLHTTWPKEMLEGIEAKLASHLQDHQAAGHWRDVVRWSSPGRGGHFAAMEAPGEYVDDVRSFFGSIG